MKYANGLRTDTAFGNVPGKLCHDAYWEKQPRRERKHARIITVSAVRVLCKIEASCFVRYRSNRMIHELCEQPTY